jgi:hypothetical protein
MDAPDLYTTNSLKVERATIRPPARLRPIPPAREKAHQSRCAELDELENAKRAWIHGRKYWSATCQALRIEMRSYWTRFAELHIVST